jgi:tetratricopeptide (TPR) repeat protein
MKLLNDNIRKFKKGTNDATDVYTLINWWSIINDSLHIDQSQLLNKPISNPSYFMTSDEIALISIYFYNTGIVLLQLGQYQDAYHYFKKAIEKNTESKKPTTLARFYFGLAEAYYHLGYMDWACDALYQSIRLDKSIRIHAQKYLKDCPSE